MYIVPLPTLSGGGSPDTFLTMLLFSKRSMMPMVWDTYVPYLHRGEGERSKSASTILTLL